MQRTIVLAIAGAAAVAALASGCGSGGSNDGSGASGKNTSASASGAAQSGAEQSGAAGQNGMSGPDSAAGKQVTAAIEQAAQQSPLKFEPEKAELTGQAKEGLKGIAKAMQGNEVKLKVATHAGYSDAAKSKQLSEQRAEAITTALESDGVVKDRVQSEPTGNEKAQGEQALDTQLSVAS
ncbi:OmpA family protein [Amycolatopsis benzoatilytica]|uniref:OmpA family protein n=1 Tax=Amycolatopsis benzoatilytica TaxID=346045 RepID=UPI000373E7A6|nr:OmpA family protein [Amycolatopsis benzoatilytica]